MAEETFIQVAPDSTGKKVRNLIITTVVDGVETDVHMQVVAISDSDGNVLGSNSTWYEQMVELLGKIDEKLEIVVDELT